MCGIVGIIAQSDVNQELYDALTAQQHRGQDAAGIVSCDGYELHSRKGKGMVRDVFRTSEHMRDLKGHMGIAHVRYPTAGAFDESEAQPFYVNSPYGITLAHNGNLINSEQLRVEMEQRLHRHINTRSDSEILLNVFAHALQERDKTCLGPDDIFAAVSYVHEHCVGAYAAIAMIAGVGIVAFRDPFAIRPLIVGRRGDDYMIASESVALTSLGFDIVADVQPGEAYFITKDAKVFKQQCAAQSQLSPCLFELVYLARPDSMIDGISVYKVRLKLGDFLAEKILQHYPDHDIDVVMPIPDTSRTAAFPLARRLGVKCREGFIKNRYIGRTFIMPEQSQRHRSVRRKLNTIPLEFQGKNVLLVDDSIVRGTTSKEIIQMARDAGAKKVYFASAAPEVRYPNVYGIDMPSKEELIAHNQTPEQIAKAIGADWLLFQDLDALIKAAQEGNPSIQRFEDCVFTGNYITGQIDQSYLDTLSKARTNESRKTDESV